MGSQIVQGFVLIQANLLLIFSVILVQVVQWSSLSFKCITKVLDNSIISTPNGTYRKMPCPIINYFCKKYAFHKNAQEVIILKLFIQFFLFGGQQN